MKPDPFCCPLLLPNQLQTTIDTSGTTTFTFDAAGNQQIEQAPSGTTTNVWDYEKSADGSIASQRPARDNHLQCRPADGSEEVVAMPETNFFWDPLSDNILQERDESGAVTADYTTEPELYGNVISQNRGAAESQFHSDALGSTITVTDDNEQVTDTRAYAAFGETIERTGSTEFQFQYIGRKGYSQHAHNNECIVRRRSYSLSVARWLSKDPRNLHPLVERWVSSVQYRASDQTLDLYQYAGNNPATLIDPSGEAAVVVPTPPQWIAKYEAQCASKGMVTAGPITTRYDYKIGSISCGTQVTNCNCRTPPTNTGTCTPQELAYLHAAKDAACIGAGRPYSRNELSKA